MKTTKMLAILFLALGLIASVANADFTFGTPTNLGPPINSSSHDEGPCISPDGLSLYYASSRPGSNGLSDLWVSERAAVDDYWASPVNLGTKVNSSAEEYAPYISADGLQLYFYSNRPGSYGPWDLWVATRQEVQNEWSTPKNVGPPVNGSTRECDPVISADGLELYFNSYNRAGGYGSWDVWVATRQTTADDWGTPVNLGPMVNSPAIDGPGSISADGLMLFLHSTRPGGNGGYDMWVTRRATRNDPWEESVNLGPSVNSPTDDIFPTISFDNRWLYFSDFEAPHRPGGFGGVDIWQVSISPVVDINGDGIVDSADMCIIVDHWGENYPLCDIGPTPLGDGIVDVQDLIVLAEHLFEEIPPVE